MTNDYDAIAGSYDFLSRIIFKKSIVEAQVFLLQSITSHKKILIIGGGTGWLLEEIEKRRLENINITYVEKSQKMIALAKAKNIKNISIHFIHNAIENFISEEKYDVVYTAFLLDNFKADKLNFILLKLKKLLAPNALWLYADFVIDKERKKLWQPLLVKIMYLFFKLTANIETQQLINTEDFFKEDFAEVKQAAFFSGFIQSKIYRLKSSNV